MCRRTTKEQLEWRIDNFLKVFSGNRYQVEPSNSVLDRWYNSVKVGDKVDFPNKKHGITTATIMKIIRVSERKPDMVGWRMPKNYILMKTVNGQWVTHESKPLTFKNIIKVERDIA